MFYVFVKTLSTGKRPSFIHIFLFFSCVEGGGITGPVFALLLHFFKLGKGEELPVIFSLFFRM